MNKEVSKILRLRHLRVGFRILRDKDGKVHGEAEVDNRQIYINLKSNIPPAKIFLHECLHVMYSKAAETTILQQENTVWNKLTHKEITFLYKKMFRCAQQSL
jgi:hypothetical protein